VSTNQTPTPQEQVAALQAENRLLKEMRLLEGQIAAIKSDLAIMRAEYPSLGPSVSDSPEVISAHESVTLEQRVGALHCEKERLLDIASLELFWRLPAEALFWVRCPPPARLSALFASVQKHREEKSARQRAEQIRLDEEERRSPEYRREVRRELDQLDEEASELERENWERRTGDDTEQGAAPEDLRKTWREEDKGRVPSLDDLEEDDSSELPLSRGGPTAFLGS